MQEEIQEFTPAEYLYGMPDQDLLYLIETNEMERFCNALTLDLANLNTVSVTNKA